MIRGANHRGVIVTSTREYLVVGATARQSVGRGCFDDKQARNAVDVSKRAYIAYALPQ